MSESWKDKEIEAERICKGFISAPEFSGVKIIGVEYSNDGSELAIYLGTELEEKVRVNTRKICQQLQNKFPDVKVEVRQIGPRDVAKYIGGLGACGLEKRCCTSFLTEFSSISIRMAKTQGISLTPTEITGMCGRLRCCLIYENEQYEEARRDMPKRNKRVGTPDGEGKVISMLPLKGTVIVDIPEVGRREFPKEEITLVNQPQKPKAKRRRRGAD